MRTILHILTKPADDLTRAIIETQRTLPDTKIEVMALDSDPNYDAMVEKIFASDSIEVW
ncbi:MAG TPA: hypothetical protein VK530_15730 [Candidatus Acidoferrum sp.]|nr:hypothetical protein [Candidatus Acidoferrum sp.]